MRIINKETLFQGHALDQDMVGKSVRGGVATLSAHGVQFFLRIGSMAVLARLLTPADYGLIGMVTVIITFAQMFTDAGLSMATVQKDHITHEQISTLFWVNVWVSVVLGLCILAGAPLIAQFYGKPELTAVTAVLACSFMVSGLVIQHKALLRRHMQFGTLARIQVVSQVISIMATIALAVCGWRYWALVGGSLVLAFTDLCFTLFFCRWVPGRMRRGTNARSMLLFGGHLTGFNFLNYFSRNADNVIIGKFISSDALGIYSRAYQLLMLPISMISGPLSHVALPALCRLNEDRDRLHKYYLHILYMLSLVASPIAGAAYLMSRELVVFLLGPNWLLVSDVFGYLAIGGLLQPLYNTQAWLHLAVGRSDRVFRWGLVGSPIIIASFIIGIKWGINGVAFCYSLAIIINTVGSLAYAGRSAELSFIRIVGAVFRPLLSCLLAVATVALLFRHIPWKEPIGLFVGKSIGYVFSYMVFLFLMFKGFQPLRDLMAVGARINLARNLGRV
ncbi:lipopolysaccharide biosynthesis protein [Pontiella sulfatireligans]|uniref:Teichuronic acid biosynthesis protein TuaB n=1 Tax=Pontiella sulfatireligans TaxID=2750658 RepID=A0A6C2UDP0_9BACT|nr:lipopolysaccharide biosynthesis protein [Pontiella sulfatireligans]VGO18255.1 Teichuronic acid biosynthesis protein TuaB [Pontiella sulfatireligans]